MEFGGIVIVIVIVVNYLNWRAIQCNGDDEGFTCRTQKHAGCPHAHTLVSDLQLIRSWFVIAWSSPFMVYRFSIGQISIFMKFNMIKMNVVRGRFAFFLLPSLSYISVFNSSI